MTRPLGGLVYVDGDLESAKAAFPSARASVRGGLVVKVADGGERVAKHPPAVTSFGGEASRQRSKAIPRPVTLSSASRVAAECAAALLEAQGVRWRSKGYQAGWGRFGGYRWYGEVPG